MADRCPSCFCEDTRRFYEARGVPVHGVLLMQSREEALACPRGDVVLVLCESCGFVFNCAFDASAHDFGRSYEPTQWFSPRFKAFAKSLAGNLVDKYDLRGKHILEIGCGKGEFLALLCRLGDNRGTGIDPTCDPERIAPDAAGRIDFIQDFYSEKYAHLAADFICCRHTLEHIAQTGEFMRMLRRSVDDGDGPVVFFEVPDVTRILHEGAFWDVYHEHCSYFAAGSLRGLFETSGFEVLEVRQVYDGQYLIIAGRPVSPVVQASEGSKGEVAALEAAVGQFERQSAAQVQHWSERIAQSAADGKRTVIWGSGSKAVSFLSVLSLGEEVECVVDVNPHKHGKFMPGTGHQIVSPQCLPERKPDCVVVMNPIYKQEIQADLDRMGLAPEVLLL
ncbi:MAG: class I SAM-dependent methyltransferase [Planctomycetota bacterium]